MKIRHLLLLMYLCACKAIADSYGACVNAEIIEAIDPVTFIINITQKKWPDLIRKNVLLRVAEVDHLKTTAIEQKQSWQLRYQQPVQLENLFFTEPLIIIADLYIDDLNWREKLIKEGMAEIATTHLSIHRPQLKNSDRHRHRDMRIRKIVGFKKNRLIIQPFNWSGYLVRELPITIKNFERNIDTQDKEQLISSELHNFVQSLEEPMYLREIEKNKQFEVVARLMCGEFDVSQYLNQFCKDKDWKTDQETKKTIKPSPPASALKQKDRGNPEQTVMTHVLPTEPAPLPLQPDNTLKKHPGSKALNIKYEQPLQQSQTPATRQELPTLKPGIVKWTETADKWLQRNFSKYTKLKILMARCKFYFHPPEMPDIARYLGSFGTLGIKIGQMIATMEDLPSEHRRHFLPLCDKAQPADFSMIQRAIHEAKSAIEALKAKGDISPDLIDIIDIEQPYLGTGSIAQAHKGTIVYEGKPVECVFKIVKEGVESDLKNAYENLQPILDFITSYTSEAFSDTIFYNLTGVRSSKSALEKKVLQSHLKHMQNECDMELEKAKLERYKKAIDEIGINYTSVPRVYFATHNVLIMEYIPGRTLSALYLENSVKADSLYLQAWNIWEQVAQEKGLIHGDFHPGNIIVQDGKKPDSPDKLVFIDGAAIMNNCISVKQLNRFKKNIKFLYKKSIAAKKYDPPLMERTSQERVEYIRRLLIKNNSATPFKTNEDQLAKASKEVKSTALAEETIFLLENLSPPFYYLDLSPERQFDITFRKIDSVFTPFPDEEKVIHPSEIVPTILDRLANDGFSLPEGFSYRHQSYVRMRKFKEDRATLLQKDTKYRLAAESYERKNKAKIEAQSKKTELEKNFDTIKKEYMEKSEYFRQAAFKWYTKKLYPTVDFEFFEKANPDYKYRNLSLLQDWYILYLYSESLKASDKASNAN
ncbi:AarF/UbiB family protein [Endozoicomonas sp. Mp262]|uniref:AarF/UbiB family protein n=1 Tax=Endozoicomonas sp. Mp262 TaxID=2919499 RepID=UPI0021D86424